EVPDEAAALQGACDIVAETWAEDAATRSWLFDQARWGQIVSKTKRGLKSPDPKFQQYFDHREPIQRVPSHRLLAMKRGESEGVLSIGLALEDDVLVRQLKSRLVRSADFEFARE